MKILSIDTASKMCGVSILENENLIIKSDQETDKSHSEKLMPIIDETFSNANLSLKDIDLIVCDKGPGSFTGIRIGVSTAMAFSDSLKIRATGVNSLEALSYNSDAELVCSLIDARHNNCYYCIYKNETNKNRIAFRKELTAPSVASIAEIIEFIKSNYNEPIYFVGDGFLSHKDYIKDSIKIYIESDESLCTLDSYKLGLAGYYRYLNNSLENTLPMYLRKPQAEIQLEEKLNANK